MILIEVINRDSILRTLNDLIEEGLIKLYCTQIDMNVFNGTKEEFEEFINH